MTKNTELKSNIHLPGVIRLDLFTGVSIDITPVSQFILVGIQEKSNELYPDPDKTPFMKELPGAAIEGQQYLDDKNPEYRRLVRDVALKRNRWIKESLYRIAIEPSPPESRESLIGRFSGDLEKLGGIMPLTDDAWLNTLLYAVLRHGEDMLNVDAAMMQNAPLTFDEVADGLRIFRLDLPKQNGATVAGSGSQVTDGKQD